MPRIRVILTVILVMMFLYAISEAFGLREIIQHALAFLTSLNANAGAL